MQVVMAYTVGIAACLAAFYFTPASWTVVQWTTVFFIGFFLYGPQMLIGLCGAELVSTCPMLHVCSGKTSPVLMSCICASRNTHKN